MPVVGSVKEKVLAAHRYGLKTVILPKRNEGDLDDVPEAVRNQMTFVFAERVEDVVSAALTEHKVEEPLPQNGHAEAPAPETEPKPVAEVTVVEG